MIVTNSCVVVIYACAKTTFFFSSEFKTPAVVKRVVLQGIYMNLLSITV